MAAGDSQIVCASPELPLHPDGLIKPAQAAVSAPDVTELRKMFDEARTTQTESHKDQQRDRDWYDGPKQLDQVRRILRGRGQPEIWTNRIQPAIDGILGVMEGSRVDPRAYPRTPQDEDSADVATKTLRYIADVTSFDETKLDCAENFWIEGECAAIIECDGEDITVTQIRWEEFFYDPRSRRHDYKDARYLGFAKWLSTDLLAQLYPAQYAQFGEMLLSEPLFETKWGDRPENLTPWVSRKDRRCLVVTLFHQVGGRWYRCVYCAAGVLEHTDAGYYDHKGRSLCPIEAAACYVDRENRRYGRVRNMIPIQDEINARRSRLLHLANSRQIQERELGATQVDAEVARAEASKADGVIPPGWMLVQTTDMAAGQAQLLQESKTEIERMGPTPAVLGRQEANQSGRSRLVLQQAGLTELARPMGRIGDWEERVYRQMWWRAQQFWRAPMFIRVTDDVKAPEFLKINEPVMGPTVQQMQAPDGTVIAVPSIGVVGMKNRLAELDMDIMVETTPEQANLQAETFRELMDILRATGLQAVFTPEFEIALELAPIPDKARILERIRKGREEGQDSQAMQLVQQLQAMIQELTEGKTAAETKKVMAQTSQIETETVISALEAGAGSVAAPPQPSAA